MTVREARVMNVRNFRAEMPDEKVIVILPNGKIKGSWTPGTEGIDGETLAQIMGLVETLRPGGVPRQITVTKGLAPRFSPAPKPEKKRKP